jgi:succinate dehydrogenase / fumarate reductase cytochrome b subunit
MTHCTMRAGVLLSFDTFKKGGGLMAEFDLNGGNVAARRPLSPHLSIYRPTLTMLMSIAHRITGMALYAGTILLVWYLLAAASGGAEFATAASFLRSIFGQFILLGFTFAFLHHFFGGIRHLIWDSGYGLDHPMREWLALGTLIASLTFTIILFAAAHFLG